MSIAVVHPLAFGGQLVTPALSPSTTVAPAPTLPPGRVVSLGSRGETFVREIAGPLGAPVVMLLHGWGATADLNWHRSYEALGRTHRVVALDHRGHGRGVRANGRFRLEDCADDAVALADELGIDRFIPVGYSMGGPIASLIWKRHRSRVDGVVLCATSRTFNDTSARRAMFTMLNGLSVLASTRPLRALGNVWGRGWSQRLERRGDDAWAIEQVLNHDWTEVLAAGRAIGRFDSTAWIGEIDVPVAVVATLDDEVVPPPKQLAMAAAVNAVAIRRVRGGHSACGDSAGEFVSALVEACGSVTGARSAALTA